MLNYSILLKKISKLENIDVIRDVINSVNDNQIKNKLWLIDKLKPYLNIYTDPKIIIAAGWHGLLAHLLNDHVLSFLTNIPKENITSFDMDDTCAQIRLFDNVNYKTNNISKHNPESYDILICTSCEHVTDDQILTWIKRKKEDSLIILQSNDYFQIKDHINCKLSLSQFSGSLLKKAKSKNIDLKIINSYELEFNTYTRFMLFLT